MCRDDYQGSVGEFVSKWQKSWLTGFLMKGQEWESTQLFSIEHQVPTQGAQAAQKIGAQIFFLKAGNMV